MSEAKGRVRYILTRLCLNTGSIAVLKYLEGTLPSEGFILAVTDSGEEIKLTASTTEKRVYGLTDYFAKRGLNVNDPLFITVIGDKLQLESIAKNRDAKPDLERPAQNSTPVIPKAKFERQIIEESAYVREVREVKVSPYPKGIFYPRSNETNENGASNSENTTQASSEPHVSEPVVTRETPAPPVKQATPFEVMLENVHTSFTALGYVVSALESGLLLETKLGRLGHRVALAVTDGKFEMDAMNSILKAGRVTGGSNTLPLLPPGTCLVSSNRALPLGVFAKSNSNRYPTCATSPNSSRLVHSSLKVTGTRVISTPKPSSRSRRTCKARFNLVACSALSPWHSTTLMRHALLRPKKFKTN
jgi:hypothetical protein